MSSKHNKIILYAGYQLTKWSPEFYHKNGLGGSEIALLNLAIQLEKNGYQVFVSGDILPIVWNNIKFIPTQELHNNYKHFEFHAIIAINYLHYLNEFEDYKFNKSFFWVHNTTFYERWRNRDLAHSSEHYLNDNRLTNIICLTNWHKEDFLKRNPNVKSQKIKIIGNGIDTTLFPENVQKAKNRFIYTSDPIRGLTEILKIWPLLKQYIPNASLHICTPHYARKRLTQLERIFAQLEDVKFIGPVPPSVLYKEISKSEFWWHPTNYEETFCITALEMQYGKVTVVTSSLAALNETVGNRGVLIPHTKERYLLKSLKKVIQQSENYSKNENSRQEAHDWALKQDWKFIATKWKKLLTEQTTLNA